MRLSSFNINVHDLQMTSILQILPFEIISAIIDIVAQIDEEDEDPIFETLEDLMACCLTCRALVPLCRKHIFCSLSLRISFNPYNLNATLTSRATSFLDLLEKSPEIAHYAQRLDIHDLVFDPENCSDSEHHNHCTSLVSVMQAFTRISSISLYGCMGPLTDWKDIPTHVRRALLRIIGLPTVAHLYFSGFMDFDLSILARCVGLRNLTLFRLDLAQNNELSSSVFVAKPVQLTRLEVQFCGTSVLRRLVSQKCGDGSSMFVFEQLKTFVADFWTIEEVASATTFFKSARVEVLDISFRRAHTAEAGGALAEMVPNFKSLKDFSFSICLDQRHVDPIPRCCKPLRDMSTGKNSLEVLYIAFDISFGYSFNGDEWTELEDTLLAPGWLHLKRVNFSICVDFKDWDPEDQSSLQKALQDLPQKQLQRLASTERFSFSFNLNIDDEDDDGADEEDDDEEDDEDDDDDEGN